MISAAHSSRGGEAIVMRDITVPAFIPLRMEERQRRGHNGASPTCNNRLSQSSCARQLVFAVTCCRIGRMRVDTQELRVSGHREMNGAQPGSTNLGTGPLEWRDSREEFGLAVLLRSLLTSAERIEISALAAGADDS